MSTATGTAAADKRLSLLRVLGPVHVWALGVGIVLVGEYMGWNFSVGKGGMIAGLGTTFYYMVMTQPWMRSVFGVTSPIELWWGIQPISAGLFGVPIGFAVIIIVSLLTGQPRKDTQDLVEHVRYPDLKPA